MIDFYAEKISVFWRYDTRMMTPFFFSTKSWISRDYVLFRTKKNILIVFEYYLACAQHDIFNIIYLMDVMRHMIKCKCSRVCVEMYARWRRPPTIRHCANKLCDLLIKILLSFVVLWYNCNLFINMIQIQKVETHMGLSNVSFHWTQSWLDTSDSDGTYDEAPIFIL